jgi:hypothetical protein
METHKASTVLAADAVLGHHSIGLRLQFSAAQMPVGEGAHPCAHVPCCSHGQHGSGSDIGIWDSHVVPAVQVGTHPVAEAAAANDDPKAPLLQQ